MRDQAEADTLEFAHLARVFEIDPRLAEFKKYFPRPIPAEMALAMKSASEDDDAELVYETPPSVERSRAKHQHHQRQVEVKLEPMETTTQPVAVVADISNEISKMEIISPRKKKRQTKISSFFAKSS